jgi:nucleoside-diphosphate-sugar epimerase
MKVFVAGASGAIGKRLVPQLLSRNHEVIAMTRSPRKAASLRALGAEPVVADGLDRGAVMDAVLRSRPEVIIHEMTGLAGVASLKKFDQAFAVTNRLRTEGTDYLLEAARAAGVRRFLAQSFAGWNYTRTGTELRTEDHPFVADPPASGRQSLKAIQHLERVVLSAPDLEGIALRYAGFYGPDTSIDVNGDIVDLVRKRGLPIIGKGTGVWSFIHVDDAAAATVAAMERGAPGVYNVADDEPAPVFEWLPGLARLLGAKPPRHVPAWLGRLAAGEMLVLMMTQIRGISNARARQELGWAPRYVSWREGFRSLQSRVPSYELTPELG